jgi:4-amino-4-deoxy-L-arabinose transferase-like glycosyltransferase
MSTEPSVLDFLLAKLQFWKKSEIDFEPYLRDETVQNPTLDDDPIMVDIGEIEDNTPEKVFDVHEEQELSLEEDIVRIKPVFPLRLFISIALILSGQWFMELSGENKSPAMATFFYLISAGLLVWSFMAEELRAPGIKTEFKGTLMNPVKGIFLILSAPFLISAVFLMEANRFTVVNLVCWLVGVTFFINGLWVDDPEMWKAGFLKVKDIFSDQFLRINIRWFDLLLIFVALMAIFFRTYLLDSVPAEMFSDQAEKLLDVQDVLDGQYSIFFPRNTGREAFQMYLSALVAKFVGIQFLTLKIGTALCGLLMLPYIYLLGKEIANKRVGLYAVIFASFAYWPNVIARVGLRYILYSAFAAPTLYYLFRGLKRQHRNDFILSGIFLGIGLHGYSSFRFIPFVVIVVAGLYLIHSIKDKEKRKTAIYAVLIIGLVSLTLFIPLMRYWAENPEMFSYRMSTRLGTAETDYPGNPIFIFFSNFWKASLMFFNDNGEVWVHSITHRPALDLITAGFYFIGVLVMILDYFKKFSWEYASLLFSIPLLLMPSILSLAFPDENPCLNRTSAAMVPVFIVAGFGMESIMRSIQVKLDAKAGKHFVVLLTISLLLVSAVWNYDLVFNQYADQFVKGAWNTSDIGQVIKEYAQTTGSYDSAYVIPYPHWVDTRLVGINAGAPRTDFALSPEFIGETLNQEGSKLFIFKYDDMQSLDLLTELYPEGTLKFYDDQYEGKDFYIFLVP